MAHHALDPDEQEFGDEIASEVLEILHPMLFFEKLESRVFPNGDSGTRNCDHSYQHTESILQAGKVGRKMQECILVACKSQGGFCDCEILYNVDDRTDCPRARYWRRKLDKLEWPSL
jgi:hypothetical protein